MRQQLVLALAASLLVSVSANAQRGPVVAIGTGFVMSERLEGSAGSIHASVGIPPYDIGPVPGLINFRVEAFAQRGSASGSGFSCERKDQLHCAGRSDEIDVIGGSIYTTLNLISWKGMMVYVTPIGVGVYRHRTRSSEVEGPIGMCFVNGNLSGDCPGNPPWSSVSYHSERVSAGYTTGLGVEYPFERITIVAELRAHRLLDRKNSNAGSLPLTFGIRF